MPPKNPNYRNTDYVLVNHRLEESTVRSLRSSRPSVCAGIRMEERIGPILKSSARVKDRYLEVRVLKV